MSLLLCAMLVCGFSTPAVAAAPTDYGMSVNFNKSYKEDGKFWMSFSFNTGIIAPNAFDAKTEIWAEIYNSAGKKILSWKKESFEPNKEITRRYSYNLNSLPTGKYTFRLNLRISGSYRDGSLTFTDDDGWYWLREINHTAPVSVWLDSAALFTRDDGSYANRIKLGYSGAKGKVPNMEIYDMQGNLVCGGKGKELSSDKGAYSFIWSGFPRDGGVQCESGNYKIKYWLDGGNPKQSQVWLDIY